MTGRECAVDYGAILSRLPLWPLRMGQTGTSTPVVIRRDLWNGLGLRRYRIEVGAQILEIKANVHRFRIACGVKVIGIEVYYFVAGVIQDIRVPDIPLVWDGPVMNLGAR